MKFSKNFLFLFILFLILVIITKLLFFNFKGRLFLKKLENQRYPISINETLREDKKTEIDNWLEECINKDNTTAGMTNCIYEAGEMYDKKLNEVYQELMVNLSIEEKELLKMAQVQWIKFRDTEYEFINGLDLEGSMYIPMKAYLKLLLTKERVKILEEYLSLLVLNSEDRNSVKLTGTTR